MTARSYGGGGQGLCDDSTKEFAIKRIMMGEGAKKFLSCVTSFMDDP